MSEHLATAVVAVTTDNAGLDAGLRKAQMQTDSAAKNMEQSIGKRVAAAGDHMTKLGRNMTSSMTVPLLALGGAATKVLHDYNASLTRIETQAGASAKEIANMRQELLKLAPQVSTTPAALADGLYHIESAGFSGAKALSMLRSAAKLAALGNANLEDTTQGVIATMASHIKGIHSAADAMAGLNAVVGTGDTKMEDLAQAMSTGIMAVAANTGLSFKDVGAALATLTDNAMQAEPAAMRLRMSLALMAAPSAEAVKNLKEIGLNSTTLADDMHKPNGLLVAIEDLKSHLEDSGKTAEEQQAIISNAFGGGQSSAAIQILLRELDRLKSKYEEQAKVMSPETVNKAWATYRKGIGSQIDTMKAQAEASLIELGQAVTPELLKVGKEVADDVTKIANAFHSLPPEAQTMIVRGGLVMASMGPALRLAGILTTGVGRLYDAALIVKKLASGNGLVEIFGKKSSGVGGEAGGSAIGTMEVGTLIAKSMIGGGAGEGSTSTTTAVRTAETEAEAEAGGAGTAAGETGLLATAGSKVMGGAGVGLAGMALSQMLGFVIGGNTGQKVASIGTGASAGAGLGTMVGGPLGAAIGAALGAGVVEGISLLKKGDYGKDIANAIFDKGFGGAAATSLASQTATALDKYKKLTSSGTKTPQWFNTFTNQWQGQSKTTAAEQGTWQERFKVTGVDPKSLAEAEAAAHTAGSLVAKQLEAGWNQYKFQSEPIMFSQFENKIKKLPPAAQAAAADSAVKFAQGLEKSGRMSQGSTVKFIEQIEHQFPGLVQYMGIQANAGAKQFEKHLDLEATERKLNGQLKNIAGDFPQVQHAMSSTAGDAQQKAQQMVTALLSVNTKGSKKMADQVNKDLLSVANALKDTKGKTNDSTAAMVTALERVVAKGTKPMRQQAQSDLDKLRQKTSDDLQKAADGAISNAKRMQTEVSSNYHHMQSDSSVTMSKIQSDTYTAMSNFSNNVTTAMANGSLSAGQGMNLLIKNLNSALKELGQKQLSSIQVAVMSRSVANEALLKAGKTPQGGFRATGGLVQFGMPGDHGVDNILANIGGTDVMVGSGEQAMVLTHQQQALLNMRLADMGGLSGMFQRVSTPHYMATGGQVPTSVKAPTVSGSGTIADIVKASMSEADKAANKYLSQHSPKASAGAPTGAGGPVPPGSARDWLVKALKITGYFSQANLSALYGRMMQESGGNPHSINLWDSNAAAGHPSEGLLQTIGPTFAAYHMAGMDDIWNPIDNTVAAIRYMMADYGHIVGPSGSGYARGGIIPHFSGGGKTPPSKESSKQKAYAKANKGKHHKAAPKLPRPVHSGKHSAGVGAGMGSNGTVLGAGGPFPFVVNDTAPISAILGSLMGLDGDNLGFGSGTSAVTTLGNKMSNLMNWWDAGLGAGGFPALGTPNFNSWASPGDFVIDTDANGNSITPYVSGNINTVVDMLGAVTGLEQATVNDLLQARSVSNGLTDTKGPVWAAIKRRQKVIAQIKARIASNVKRIKAAKAQRAKFLKDKAAQAKRQKHASDQITKLQGQLTTERKKKKPDKSKIASLSKQINKWEGVFQDARTKGVNDNLSAFYLERSVITPLEQENKALGGSPDKEGTGGELGQITSQLGAAAANDPLTVALGNGSSASGLFGVISQASGWASQLGAPAGDISSAKLQLKEYQVGLAGLTPGATAAADADAAQQQASNGSSGSSTADQITQLKAQLWDQEQQAKAVGAVQTAVLAQLPPFGGVFHTGGVVPGPLGAERLILAQGGEVVNPIGASPTNVNVNVADGMGWLKRLISTEVQQQTRTMSRRASRGLPGHGGGGY